jgi:ketosteroid isomerase-like protein
MRIRWAVSAATIGISIGCASEPAVDVLAEREALRGSAEAYEQAATIGDVDTFVGSYASAGTMMPPNEEAISGEEAIRTFFEGFTSLDGFAFQSELQTVEVSADAQMGYTVGRIVLSWMEGDAQMGGTFRDVHIWTRDADGAWRIVADVWNSLDPVEGMD